MPIFLKITLLPHETKTIEHLNMSFRFSILQNVDPFRDFPGVKRTNEMLKHWFIKNFKKSGSKYFRKASFLRSQNCRITLFVLLNWKLIQLVGKRFQNWYLYPKKTSVVYKWPFWRILIWSQKKNKTSFLYTPFWTHFIAKKRHHRNKYLGLPILTYT